MYEMLTISSRYSSNQKIGPPEIESKKRRAKRRDNNEYICFEILHGLRII